MSVNEQLTDQERVELTKKSYENLQVLLSVNIILVSSVELSVLKTACEHS